MDGTEKSKMAKWQKAKGEYLKGQRNKLRMQFMFYLREVTKANKSKNTMDGVAGKFYLYCRLTLFS
jgi:hypothetical protein